MKHPAAFFREEETAYHRLQRSTQTLVQQAQLPLLFAVVLYKMATSLLFIPAVQKLWALVIHFAPASYLRNSSASDIYTSPFIVGGIVIIALLASFWTLYGFSIFLHGLALARREEPIRLPALFWHSLTDILHAFLPHNWPVLLYAVALVPFTGFFLLANHITQLAVPEYLLGLLQSRPFYPPLFAAALLLILLLCVCWVLVLPLFTLERKSFWAAAKESLAFVQKRFGQTALLLAHWNLSAALQAGLSALVVLVPLYGILLGVGMVSTSGMLSLSRAILRVELPFFSFWFDCFMTAAQCTILAQAAFLHREQFPAEAAAPKAIRDGRRLFALAAAGATVLTLALSMVYFVLPEDDSIRTLLGGAMPIVTAHRGYSSIAPENTLPAFQDAIDSGCERAELDVQMTKDGVVMVTHDTSLRRCTGRNANIYDLTYEEVRKLDAGWWFGSAYRGTKIPTLEEVLDLCKGKIQLNVEIKPNAHTPTLEAETVRILLEKGFEQDCVITSQSYDTLCKVKELAPEIPTGYILALGVGSAYDLPCVDFFSIESTFITSGMVQQAHLRGKTVSAWTVNRESDVRELLQLGVDDLITDKPEGVWKVLSEDDGQSNRMLTLRDKLRSLLRPAETSAESDATDEVIDEALEDPDELLDEA